MNSKANVVEQFLTEVESSVKNDSFVKMSFGKYMGGDPEFRELKIDTISTTDGRKLRFIFSYKTKDITKNYQTEAGLRLISEITGKDFHTANLFTQERSLSLDFTKKLKPQLHIRKHNKPIAVSSEHNRSKSRLADPAAKYFRLLGISSQEGKVLSGKYDKFRQVDKFIQIADSLINSTTLAEGDNVTMTDLGSGKSYMTFALFDHLKNVRKFDLSGHGIEQRSELAKISNDVAGKSGFDKLSFTAGKIPDKSDFKADIVTALHACDTATDDSIAYAVRSEAKIIMLAPCCQKYLRKKIKIPKTLEPLLKHPIHEERFSVMLTDSLRALVLEYFGYSVKVFEFVSDEHTSRNTMIAGVRNISNTRNAKALTEIKELKEKFGLEDFYLDKKIELH